VRVLYLSEFFHPYLGGVEVLSAALLPEIARRGHQVLVVTSHGDRDLPDEEEWRGVTIRRQPWRHVLESRRTRIVNETTLRLATIKRSFAPDVIHLGAIGPSLFFHLRSAQAVRAPTLATVQTERLAVDGATIAARVLRESRWVRFVSRRLMTAVCGRIPELRDRASVIYSFFPNGDTPPRPLPFAPPRLLCLGRLIPDKNLSLALEAVATARRSLPQIRLTIAGEGPQHDELVRLAERLELSGAVEFRGRVEPAEVPSLINQCTALLISSLREGLANAAIAAATMGRPIVATRVGSIDEVLIDGATGLLVEPSAAALAAGILRLVRDPEEAARMGARARARAGDLFDRDKCVDAFEVLYERIRADP
jgi:glycosyltransferase involved in cell wall biosynthesis